MPQRLIGSQIGSQLAFAAKTVTKPSDEASSLIRLAMEVFVSLVAIGAGIWVLVSGTGSADVQKIATGWMGVVLGFWLK